MTAIRSGLAPWFVALGLIVLAAPVAANGPLASGELEVLGSRLTLHGSDVQQTLNVGEPGVVRTCYGGVGADCGTVQAGDPRIAGLVVLAELSGPELPEPLPVEAVPGGSFLLPGFQQRGDYLLESIRLVNRSTGALIGMAEPSAAVLHVEQILVASATVTTLSLADLQARGISVTQENFQAFNFAVGFAFGDEIVTINLPVIYQGGGQVDGLDEPSVDIEGVPDYLRGVVERW